MFLGIGFERGCLSVKKKVLYILKYTYTYIYFNAYTQLYFVIIIRCKFKQHKVRFIVYIQTHTIFTLTHIKQYILDLSTNNKTVEICKQNKHTTHYTLV